jgi:SAM-dependent methyltransferase
VSSGDPVSEVVRRIEGETHDLGSRLRRLARLALPADAKVFVVSRGQQELLDLNVPSTLAFPWDHWPSDTSDEVLIDELERLRVEAKMHFLLVPESARSWWSGHGELKRHVEANHRLVVDEAGTGVIFALKEPADTPEDGLGRDGVPVPPPEMVHLVAGMFEFESIYEPFIANGEASVASIKRSLDRNGLDIESFDSILDFGCGSGRVMRQWKSLTRPKLHGSDYNPYMIEWCRRNLPFAEFTVNGVAPPLDYDDNQFDFVYALSVFTHFVEVLQLPWAQEIARVLRPGGYAHVTVHGVGRSDPLSEAERARFDAGELVVLWDELAGTNAVAAFHPERYLHEVFAPRAGFEVVDFVPDGQPDMNQDAVLLRRI